MRMMMMNDVSVTLAARQSQAAEVLTVLKNKHEKQQHSYFVFFVGLIFHSSLS